MLSIWDNPSITKVRRCAVGDGDVVFQLGDGDGGKKKRALLLKSAVLLVSSSVMENVFKMGSTGSHFTNH